MSNKCKGCVFFMRGLVSRDGHVICGAGPAGTKVKAEQTSCDKFKAREQK